MAMASIGAPGLWDLEAYADQQQGREDPIEEPEASVCRFYICKYKIADCTRTDPHAWTECPYAHPREQNRRRCPFLFKYASVPCPDITQRRPCPRGQSCPMAHSLLEFWLHPDRFRTQLCKHGQECNRKVCFFAHRLRDLRPEGPSCNAHLLLLDPQQQAQLAETAMRWGLASPSGASTQDLAAAGAAAAGGSSSALSSAAPSAASLTALADAAPRRGSLAGDGLSSVVAGPPQVASAAQAGFGAQGAAAAMGLGLLGQQAPATDLAGGGGGTDTGAAPSAAAAARAASRSGFSRKVWLGDTGASGGASMQQGAAGLQGASPTAAPTGHLGPVMGSFSGLSLGSLPITTAAMTGPGATPAPYGLGAGSAAGQPPPPACDSSFLQSGGLQLGASQLLSSLDELLSQQGGRGSVICGLPGSAPAPPRGLGPPGPAGGGGHPSMMALLEAQVQHLQEQQLAFAMEQQHTQQQQQYQQAPQHQQTSLGPAGQGDISQSYLSLMAAQHQQASGGSGTGAGVLLQPLQLQAAQHQAQVQQLSAQQQQQQQQQAQSQQHDVLSQLGLSSGMLLQGMGAASAQQMQQKREEHHQHLLNLFKQQQAVQQAQQQQSQAQQQQGSPAVAPLVLGSLQQAHQRSPESSAGDATAAAAATVDQQVPAPQQARLVQSPLAPQPPATASPAVSPSMQQQQQQPPTVFGGMIRLSPPSPAPELAGLLPGDDEDRPIPAVFA